MTTMMGSMALAMPFALTACSLPHAGPSYGAITDQSKQQYPVSVVRVDDQVTDILNSDKKNSNFYDVFGNNKPDAYKVTYGDSVDLFIWESAPALLFGTGSVRRPQRIRKKEKRCRDDTNRGATPLSFFAYARCGKKMQHADALTFIHGGTHGVRQTVYARLVSTAYHTVNKQVYGVGPDL